MMTPGFANRSFIIISTFHAFDVDWMLIDIYDVHEENGETLQVGQL